MKYFFTYCFCAFVAFSCSRDAEILSNESVAPTSNRIATLVTAVDVEQEVQEVALYPEDVAAFEEMLLEYLGEETILPVSASDETYLPAPTPIRSGSNPGTVSCMNCIQEFSAFRNGLQAYSNSQCQQYFQLVTCCAKSGRPSYILVITKPSC